MGVNVRYTSTLVNLLEEKTSVSGDRPFIRFGKNNISLGALSKKSNQVANSLLELGLKKGDTICTMLPNCLEYLYSWFGCAKAGVVEVPINTAYRGELLRYIINNCDARFMILEKQFIETLKFIEDGLKNLQMLVVLDPGHSQEDLPSFDKLTMIPYEQVFQGSSDPPPVEVKPTDISDIMYTSGTTGPSKGVMHCHKYWTAAGRILVDFWNISSDDVFLSCLPLFHQAARADAVITLTADATLALVERFSVSNFWNECRQYGATSIHLLSAAISMLHKQRPHPEESNNQVHFACFSGTPPAIHEDFERRFDLKIFECWGMTECSGPLLMPYDESRVGSCGKVAPGWDVRIHDSEDNELGPNEVGEIVVRPIEPFIMFSGYYKMPEKTLESFRNLWFHTGDLAYHDEEGFFFYVDRKKDAIRRRGENISSFEIEMVVNTHPAILESAAFAVPSDLGEDEVMVMVVLKEGEKLAPEELIAFCEPRMAYFAIPRYVEYANSLPKTQTGRIEKYKLKEKGIKENTWDREKVGYKLKR